jgi:hypothetical protein
VASFDAPVRKGLTVLVDLVQTTTNDGVRLDASYQAVASPPTLPLDAAVLVHGTGGNFYSSTLFDALAERLLVLGVGVLRVNTRGHDLMSMATTARGGRRYGAAYEELSGCIHDLPAWVDWLKKQGRSRIGLIGHSSGALKCLYSQAYVPDPAVTRLVAISPPRLSYSWFVQSENGAEFLNTFGQAQALVDSGEPAHLLDVRLPLPFVITAAGYVEKYGPNESYNYLKFIDRLRCSILCTFGEVEVAGNMAFRGAPEAVVEAAPGVRVVTIPGADHFYSGVREALMACVEGWLREADTAGLG